MVGWEESDAAAIFRNGGDRRRSRAGAEAGAGQVLVKSLACGICGSDLHARRMPTGMVELAKHFLPQSRWTFPATSYSVTSSAARC